MIGWQFSFIPLRRPHLRTLTILSALVFGAVLEGYGQDQVRKYATRQEVTAGLLTSVSDPTNAVNGNPLTHSTLNRLLGAGSLITVTQYLEFDQTYSDKEVTVKLSFPQGLLELLDGVEIQPFTNLRIPVLGINYTADAAGKSFSADNLLGLLSGPGEMEFTVKPQTSGGTAVPFKGVWVRMKGVALGQSLNLFHAYIMEDGSVLNCEERNEAIDVLSGTRAGTIDALSALGSVSNPYNVLESDLNTHATLNVLTGLLNATYLNTIFRTASQPGQRVRIILESPGSLLSLGLLSSFSIQPMLGSANAGPSINSGSSLLSLKVLPGTNKVELAYTINEVFDRIELRFDNTVTALASLNIYEVSRLPRIVLIGDTNLLKDTLTGCGQVDLAQAIANFHAAHYTYRYYTSASGGTPLPSSKVAVSGTYYIEAVDPITACVSDRVSVNTTITPTPGRPNLTITNANL